MNEILHVEFEMPARLLIKQLCWVLGMALVVGVHVVLVIISVPRLVKEKGWQAIAWWGLCVFVPLIGPVIYRKMHQERFRKVC